MVIRKYNRTLSTWLHTCCIFILLLSRKNRAQMKNVHDSSLPQQELARISKFSHSSMFGSRFGTVRLGNYDYRAMKIGLTYSYHNRDMKSDLTYWYHYRALNSDFC